MQVDAGLDEGKVGARHGAGHGAVSRNGEAALPCGRGENIAGGLLAGREWGGVERGPRKEIDRKLISGADDDSPGHSRKVREDGVRGCLGRPWPAPASRLNAATPIPCGLSPRLFSPFNMCS